MPFDQQELIERIEAETSLAGLYNSWDSICEHFGYAQSAIMVFDVSTGTIEVACHESNWSPKIMRPYLNEKHYYFDPACCPIHPKSVAVSRHIEDFSAVGKGKGVERFLQFVHELRTPGQTVLAFNLDPHRHVCFNAWSAEKKALFDLQSSEARDAMTDIAIKGAQTFRALDQKGSVSYLLDLTEAETICLQLLVNDHTQQSISQRMALSIQSVQLLIRSIKQKLNCSSLARLGALARDKGLIKLGV